MKKINTTFTIFALLFLSSYSIIYGQIISGKVQYEASLLMDSSIDKFNKSKASQASKNAYKKLMTNSSKLNYILDFNRTKSLFKKVKQLEQLEFSKNPILETRVNQGSFYSDYSKKVYLNIKDSQGDKILISYPKTVWKIEQKTKMINGYLCGKATTTIIENSRAKQKSKITAWFAFDIPFNFGPNQFGGLPGLVLEVEYAAKYKIKATKIKLSSKKEVKIKEPKKGKKISLTKYNEKIAKSFLKAYKKHNRKKN